jgi:hypothetical protein
MDRPRRRSTANSEPLKTKLLECYFHRRGLKKGRAGFFIQETVTRTLVNDKSPREISWEEQ